MKKETKQISPIKAIRAKCMECSCGQREEVKLCPIEDCALYPFRFGKNPFNKKTKTMSDEQKAAAAERMKKARESKKNKEKT